MTESLRLFAAAALAGAAVLAAEPGIMYSAFAPHEVAVSTDPDSPFWRGAPAVFADRDAMGRPVPGHRTEIRSRWTSRSLYFLFVCPYRELHLKPDPRTEAETFALWNWDVAEVFLGSDFREIRRYKEFEVSPRNEWIDLDIDLRKPHHEEGWTWNSGFTHAARIDRKAKVWYAALCIPYAAVDTHAAAAGNRLRLNLYRSQGAPPNQVTIAWQPTMTATFHTPERFGLLELTP
jgi:hypothetical protein